MILEENTNLAAGEGSPVEDNESNNRDKSAKYTSSRPDSEKCERIGYSDPNCVFGGGVSPKDEYPVPKTTTYWQMAVDIENEKLERKQNKSSRKQASGSREFEDQEKERNHKDLWQMAVDDVTEEEQKSLDRRSGDQQTASKTWFRNPFGKKNLNLFGKQKGSEKKEFQTKGNIGGRLPDYGFKNNSNNTSRDHFRKPLHVPTGRRYSTII